MHSCHGSPKRAKYNLSYLQSFEQIGLKLWKIGAIQNRYPEVVYGVMSDRDSKSPRILKHISKGVENRT